MLDTDHFTVGAPLRAQTMLPGVVRSAGGSMGAVRRLDDRFFREPSIPRPSRASGPVAPPAMQILVRLQHADGSWDLTREFADAIGQEFDVLQSVVRRATRDREDMTKAWATALALTWLDRHASDFESEWHMLAAKAWGCLVGASADPDANARWLYAAEIFLRP
jgi:hypothetical protein